MPLVALNTSTVVVPLIFKSATNSPTKLSEIAPASAESFTVPPALIMLNAISVAALYVTLPATPASVKVPDVMEMLPELSVTPALYVTRPPTVVTLAFWVMLLLLDLMVIPPAPMLLTSVEAL